MGYKFRSSAGSGQWLPLLLPLCLFPLSAKSHKFADKFVFAVITWLSISHLIKRSIFLDKSFTFDSNKIFYVVFTIPVSVLISVFTSQNVFMSCFICLVVILSYNNLISKLLSKCPGSFTMGEVQTIAQGIIAFVLHAVISLKQINQNSGGTMHSKAMDLLKLLLLGLLLLICCLSAFSSLEKDLKIYFLCFSFAMPMILIWSFYYQENLVMWFLEYCSYHKRIYLLLFWLILTVSAVSFVVWINQRQDYRASTMDRKYFHVIISAVYISGIICDIQFLCFASGIVLGAFVVLEMYRVLKVPFIGPVIEQAFHIFLDEKDSGMLILTHIYLLIGCSCPIWLYSYYVHKNTYHICLMSGIISVGFGDTSAAVGGTLFGKHHWKGSKKTLEGTACAIVIQLVSSVLFLYLGHPLSLYNIVLVVTSVFLTSLLEAKTTQVDNLVLPLFMFTFLSWVK